MSYKKCTIKKAIADIDQHKIYLPALQRKFVWGKGQIELLFDSLMRNYPFGTFLFWRLHRQKAETYVFYEFLTEYDERNPYNRRKTGAFLHEEITGVLDGQQRLSSMYIGLMGTHTEKEPYKRWWNPDAYKKMRLHLNLLSLPYELDDSGRIVALEDKNFEFRFLPADASKFTERRVQRDDTAETEIEAVFWLKVGDVLSWDDEPEYDLLIDNYLAVCQTDSQREAITQSRRFIKRSLATLHKRIGSEELINYFEVAKDDLEDILKIFVRVNSGGTVLSKTDLLFSTIVATWDDGREQIEGLLKSINEKGNGFSFGNEFLMRCCLVLTDAPVTYKVNSFKSENVQKIRDGWPQIAEAVSKTVDLLVTFGFDGGLLTSQNATIILAYYIYKGGGLDEDSKNGMRRYLLHALLNTIYGSSQDQLITSLRNAFRTETKSENGQKYYTRRHSEFIFDEVLKIQLPQQKSLAVSENDLDRLIETGKGPSAFFLLTLLYPSLRYSEVSFHQDHLHPYSGFSEANFKSMGIPQTQWPEWLGRRDRLPNLQLLSESRNTSKNATPLKQWVDQMELSVQATFAADNYFPGGASLAFSNFIDFYDQRKELLRGELRKVLAMTDIQLPEPASDWESRDAASDLE
jgi:hypothetical protein